MSHHHGASGSASLGNGIPTLFEFQEYYWAAVGSVIAVATLVNVVDIAIYRQRISSANKGLASPAKPKAWPLKINATITAMVREASNASLNLPFTKGRHVRTPTVGPTILVLTYLTMLVVFALYRLHTTNRRVFSDIGYRTGYVTVAQLPLIFLLAGKNNIIGLLAGTSYERINWLHRWASRGLLLTASLHMGYFFGDYWPYGDYLGGLLSGKGETGKIMQPGFIAWCFLAWIVLSSVAPIRGLNYEFFVIQHLVSFTAFIAFVYIHLFPENRKWVWIVVALFFFDRFVRGASMLYNVSIFHPRQRKAGKSSGILACRAEFEPVANNTTKVTIPNSPFSWTPGQHVFLSCHSVLPLQSHPFTISSIPQDGKIVLFVKAEKGGTKRLFAHAEKSHVLPGTSHTDDVSGSAVILQGPYGAMRPLRQFDSVILLAGSSGATFTMPLLRDLVSEWKTPAGQRRGVFRTPHGSVARQIRFVWVIKNRGQLEWFANQLSGVMEDVMMLKEQGKDVNVELSMYVTCDESLTEKNTILTTDSKHPPPKQEQSEGSLETSMKKTAELTETHEIVSPTNETTSTAQASCCCRTTVDDEGDLATPQISCNCGQATAKVTPGSSSSSVSSSPSPQKPVLHPGICLVGGRPQCQNIIRKSLEQSLGESAVVVCGPRGLVDDVRQSVVCLSDERAVHKGTGAQGIYLHTEKFGY